MSDLRTKNLRAAGVSVAAIFGMLGLTAASVPLYDLFCRVTGYGGTTQVSDGGGLAATGRTVEVAFNADVDPNLPWRFAPEQRKLEVEVGENRLAFYTAENTSDQPVVGQAVYNVTPFKVGYYFNKVHCFCFEQQLLQPGERVEMPVSFYVDPGLLTDPNTKDVRQITLSYTFFVDEEATAELLAARSASLIGRDGAPAEG